MSHNYYWTAGLLLALCGATLPVLAQETRDGAPPVPAMLNVQDFGAKGDGVADDTDALQRAFDASAYPAKSKLAIAPKTVLVPAGHYRITRTLKLARQHMGMTILGTGRPNALGSTYPGAPTEILYDGPQGGTLLDTVGVLGLRMADLGLHGQGKAGVLLRVNSMPGGAGADHDYERVIFSGAETGMECGADLDMCASDMTFTACEFYRCKTAFRTMGVQMLNYVFLRCSIGECETGLHFKKGGSVHTTLLAGWCCNTLIKIEGGGVNAGIFEFVNTRMETRLFNGKRTCILDAKGDAVIKFSSLLSTCLGLFDAKGPDGAVIAKADYDTPLFRLDSSVQVHVDASYLAGRIAEIKTTAGTIPTMLVISNSRFAYGDPRTDITADEKSAVEITNATINHKTTSALLPRWGKLPATGVVKE